VYNITQQFIKEQSNALNVKKCIHSKKISQHNRLDASSFVSVKLQKQTKTSNNIFVGPRKILWTYGNRKHRNFFNA